MKMKKTTVGEIKKIIREDFMMRGVPQFVITQASDSLIEELKRELLKGINLRSKNSNDRREMIAAMQSTLKDIKTEVDELVSERLQGFLQNI